MKQTLLIISGGLEAVPGILLAKKMGLHVVVSDINPHAPGLAIADDQIVASTYDVKASVAAAQKYHSALRPIDAVMCIASDVPFTVASVAKALHLPGISLESAHLATDKLAMKKKFMHDGIPVPWFTPIESLDHVKSLALDIGYPLVLKPADSRGSRGVLRLTHEVDLAWAYSYSLSYSPTKRVMLEKFMNGPQVSTESMMVDGLAYTPGFSDRNYEYLERYAPHIIENGGDLPSRLTQDQQQAVRDLVEKAALSLGITNGVVKGDIVVSDNKPYVIELAARLSGGYFCSHEIPLNTGVNFVGQAIRLALGEKPKPEDLTPQFQRAVAQRYLFPKPGKVVRIMGADEVAGRSGIVFCEIRVKTGDVIGPIDSHPGRGGVIMAVGENRGEAIERAAKAVNDISIETIS